MTAIGLTDITTRSYGEVTVAIATQTQRATHNGNPAPTTTRAGSITTNRKNAPTQ
jgi:hypothetical protein